MSRTDDREALTDLIEWADNGGVVGESGWTRKLDLTSALAREKLEALDHDDWHERLHFVITEVESAMSADAVIDELRDLGAFGAMSREPRQALAASEAQPRPASEAQVKAIDAIRALDAEIERLTPTEEECKAMSMGYQALLGMDDYIAGDHDRILAAYLQRVRGTPVDGRG